MLGAKIRSHGVKVWLINTGWSGGAYGVGERLPLPHTRRMVEACLSGELDDAATRIDPVFGLAVPTEIAGVPAGILDPRSTWSDPAAYDAQAAKLAEMFVENFAQFMTDADDEVLAAAPVVPSARSASAV